MYSFSRDGQAPETKGADFTGGRPRIGYGWSVGVFARAESSNPATRAEFGNERYVIKDGHLAGRQQAPSLSLDI